MNFRLFERYYSVLTNGIVELEIHGSKHGSSVDPGSHIVGQDGVGKHYIDGIPAHVETRVEIDLD